MGMNILFSLDAISVIAILILLSVNKVDTLILGERAMIIPEEDRKQILALLAIDAVITGFTMPDICMVDMEGIEDALEGLEGLDELLDG